MDLKFDFQKKSETVRIPDENLLGILHPVPVETGEIDLKPVLDAAARFIENHDRLLLLLNDYTRPTPSHLFLKPLLPLLTGRTTTLLICLGTHRPATETELKRLLGPEVFTALAGSIIQHNCRDRSALLFFGKTEFGTEVELNREILRARGILAINSIEPHYFAGYTGGRKTFLPGCAGYETIIHNHNLLLHPASAPLSLKDNPVHLDMKAAAKMVPRPIFSIQMVQDANHRPVAVHYGDLETSFAHAIPDAYRVYALPIKEKADIVLSILKPPYDINFYQAQRAVEFALPALKPGGIQITVSACAQGVGNDEFIRVLARCSNPSSLLKGENSSEPGWHKAARLARIMGSITLYAVMGIDPAVLRTCFMTPFPSIQKALNSALETIGKGAKVYVIPDAGAVVPVLTGSGAGPGTTPGVAPGVGG